MQATSTTLTQILFQEVLTILNDFNDPYAPIDNYIPPTENYVDVEPPAGDSAPTFTAFSGVVDSGSKNGTIEISYADLVSSGNASDDNAIIGFKIDAVTSGQLYIMDVGTNASSLFDPSTNFMIDDKHLAYWYPTTGAVGEVGAFTARAIDNVGQTSTTSVQANVQLNNVYGGPSVSGSPTATDGAYGVGETLAISLFYTGNVTFNFGDASPFLTLSNGATATYASGSGSASLVFNYVVAEGNTDSTDLSVTSMNLGGGSLVGTGTIADAQSSVFGDLGNVTVDGDAPDVVDSILVAESIDLSAIVAAGANNIEQINMEGNGSDTLSINIQDVLDITDSNNILFIDGDTDDQVIIEAGWQQQNSSSASSNGYQQFSMEGVEATLYIDEDVSKLVMNS